jgi:hypothetical protein
MTSGEKARIAKGIMFIGLACAVVSGACIAILLTHATSRRNGVEQLLFVSIASWIFLILVGNFLRVRFLKMSDSETKNQSSLGA